MPALSGIFFLSRSGRNMNYFVDETDGLNSNKVYYQVVDSLCLHMDHYEKIKKSWLCWKKM